MGDWFTEYVLRIAERLNDSGMFRPLTLTLSPRERGLLLLSFRWFENVSTPEKPGRTGSLSPRERVRVRARSRRMQIQWAIREGGTGGLGLWPDP
jgi:hypothetical protein